jgi:putative ABC transport system ATP-binding protein
MFDAPLIIADEPTASLDAVNGAEIADLLIAEASQRGATLLVATHDRALLARLDGVVQMDAGRIRSAA